MIKSEKSIEEIDVRLSYGITPEGGRGSEMMFFVVKGRENLTENILQLV